MGNTLQITRVLLNGVPLGLDPNKVVGKPGGEGTVYRIHPPGGKSAKTEVAVKIYHTKPTLRRQRKLEALLKLAAKFPPELVAPESLVEEETGRHIVGFSMRLLPPGYQPLEMLFARQYREANDLSTVEVMDLFLEFAAVLSKLHILPEKVVGGDLNPFNELFRRIAGRMELAVIDTDSIQIGSFPCEVAMEGYLTPRLYGIDLSQKPYFTEMDDWYTYLVLLFNALLLVHPFKGVHRQLRTVTQRAAARIPVFDRSVIYPVSAYPLSLVPDDLLQVFDQTFSKGQAIVPSLRILEKYRHDLKRCPTCSLDYPGNLTECPGCQALNLKVVKLGSIVKTVQATELLRLGGTTLAFRPEKQVLLAASREKGQLVVYRKETLQKTQRLVLGKVLSDSRYDFFGNRYFVVCENPYAEEASVQVYDLLTTEGPKIIVTTLCENYAGHRAVFRGGGKYFYRIFGGHLLRGQILYGDKLIEEAVASVIDHQTWFDADINSETAAGFYQVFSRFEWFLIKTNRQYRLELSELEPGEALLDHAVRFAKNSLVILRRTEKRGTSYIRLDVIERESGKMVGSRQVRLSDEPQLAPIHQMAYAGSALLLPTDIDGLLAEEVLSGKSRPFPDTKNYIDANSRLFSFENGVLTLTNNRALKLVLANQQP